MWKRASLGYTERKSIVYLVAELLITLYLLATVGVVDDRARFESAADHAFKLLEMALLTMDGSVVQDKGKILGRIEEERARYA